MASRARGRSSVTQLWHRRLLHRHFKNKISYSKAREDRDVQDTHLREDFVQSAGGHAFLKVLQGNIVTGFAGVNELRALPDQADPLLQDWHKLAEVFGLPSSNPRLQWKFNMAILTIWSRGIVPKSPLFLFEKTRYRGVVSPQVYDRLRDGNITVGCLALRRGRSANAKLWEREDLRFIPLHFSVQIHRRPEYKEEEISQQDGKIGYQKYRWGLWIIQSLYLISFWL